MMNGGLSWAQAGALLWKFRFRDRNRRVGFVERWCL